MTIRITEIHGAYIYGVPTNYEIHIKRGDKLLGGFFVGNPEPEDATLGRDLGFAYSAIDFFKIGFEAGKIGEEVIFSEAVEHEDDN